ncbi:MAG TPA: hypothetical protein VED37_01450 [Ktedonobacteraceae bacterium]|nr:hypothetical protein [Ktedonobacteraceae bacterium]
MSVKCSIYLVGAHIALPLLLAHYQIPRMVVKTLVELAEMLESL